LKSQIPATQQDPKEKLKELPKKENRQANLQETEKSK
jgi:hypothetical protein